jgi:hypothetical protein
VQITQLAGAALKAAARCCCCYCCWSTQMWLVLLCQQGSCCSWVVQQLGVLPHALLLSDARVLCILGRSQAPLAAAGSAMQIHNTP